jgi:hypothetical protein
MVPLKKKKLYPAACTRRHSLTLAQPSELRQVDHRQADSQGRTGRYGASASRVRAATDAGADSAA